MILRVPSRTAVALVFVVTGVACRAPSRDATPPAAKISGGASSTARSPQTLIETGPQQVTAQTSRRVVVAGVNLTDVGYNLGSPTAPVVVVELSDFGCPYCGEFARMTFPELDSEYVRTGKVYFKYVPFVVGMFPNSTEAARTAECAGDQNKFWPMYDQLYAAQPAWKGASSPYPLYQQYAAAIGLDGKRFAACYNGPGTHPRTKLATDAANLLGVRATPSFLVNGRPIEGALPLADFRKLLAEALKR